jgi:hypothetical protein
LFFIAEYLTSSQEFLIFFEKKRSFIMKATLAIFAFLMITGSPVMSFAEGTCDEMSARLGAARSSYLQNDYALQSETVLVEPESISEALSCFDAFSAGVDMTQYDPAAIMAWAKKFGSSLGDKACQAAKGYLDSNLRQISGSLNSATDLPYGLGSVVDVNLSSSGASVTGSTPSTGGITSQIPSTSSLPKVELPF